MSNVKAMMGALNALGVVLCLSWGAGCMADDHGDDSATMRAGMTKAREGLVATQQGLAAYKPGVSSGVAAVQKAVGTTGEGVGTMHTGLGEMTSCDMSKCDTTAAFTGVDNGLADMRAGLDMMNDADATNDAAGAAKVEAGRAAMESAMKTMDGSMSCMVHAMMM